MRVFLGLTVLTILFLMAAFWQKGITRRLEQQREHEQGLSFVGNEENNRWVKLVLGRPSGAKPMASPIQLPGAPDPETQEEETAPTTPEPDFASDVTYVVKPGDILGTICAERYGTSKPKVLKAVALYNDMENLDSLREGQTLALPAIEVLFPDGL